ncbi:GspH/FimT family protein [Thermus scotoductus]
MRTPRGFSLTELLLLLAILGTILALSSGYLNPDRQAVNQAASSLAAQVTRARLEAIRWNDFVGIRFLTGGAGGYVIFLDQNRNRTYDGADTAIQTITFGQGEWARVRLTALTGPEVLVFDPRGIPQDFTGATVTLSDRAGTYTQGVSLSPQGRGSLP